MTDEERVISLDDITKILKNIKPFRIAIKVIGIGALIVAFFLWGQFQYMTGTQDQCLAIDGFLVEGDDKEPLCLSNETLVEKGWIVDKETKTMTKRSRPMFEPWISPDFDLGIPVNQSEK